ncbi:MAG: putative sulfate exporter family transporter [bacterium]
MFEDGHVLKVVRTFLIIPVIGFLCWYIGKKEGIKRKPILYQIPWFMWVFVLVGLLASFVPTFGPLAKTLKPWAGIFFTMVLTSIGLKVDFKRMLNVGISPLIIGLACWIAVIGVFILGKFIF